MRKTLLHIMAVVLIGLTSTGTLNARTSGDDDDYKTKTYDVGTYVTIMEVGRTLKQPEDYKKLTDYGKMVMEGMKHYEEIQ